MYEHVTFEDILQRMLARVPDNMDKRQGSVIYDTLAPSALELQLMYIELDVILKETFGSSASRPYLILRAGERGIEPIPATFAVLKAEFKPPNLQLPAKARFNLNEMNYSLGGKISAGVYELVCEESGSVGNQNFGDLIPIEYIQGLETAKIADILIPARDEEETEEFRRRYEASFDTRGFGGNKKDYIQKTNSVEGVGAAKVIPHWQGGGTVKLIVLAADYSAATQTLVNKVQEEIDPLQDASGDGIAPIGHVVTVVTANEIVVNLSAVITLEAGFDIDAIRPQIAQQLDEYLLQKRREWAENATNMVRIAQIETRIMSIVGVIDIQNTAINGAEDNLPLGFEEIPIAGSVAV